MHPRFFDPMGREVSAESFYEWAQRADLRLVREFFNDTYRVRLMWMDEVHNVFGDPPVFKIEVCRKGVSLGGWSLDPVLSGAAASTLLAAIELYRKTCISLGVAEVDPIGIYSEIGNKAPPTTHELQIDANAAETEEAIEEVEVSFVMPKLTVVERSEERPQPTVAGAAFSGLADGNDAW